MKPILTYQFPVVNKPSFAMKVGELGPKTPWPTWNPWLAELEWAGRRADEAHAPSRNLRATIWAPLDEPLGKPVPWRADEALANIASQLGGQAQDPSLEEFFPDAFWTLHRLRQSHGLDCAMRVLFPALAANWNKGADASVIKDSYARRNSLGRRLARAVCFNLKIGESSGSLTPVPLFPRTLSGEEYPQQPGSVLLQIHR